MLDYVLLGLLLTLALALNGCGQTGPLYHPEAPEPAPQEQQPPEPDTAIPQP